MHQLTRRGMIASAAALVATPAAAAGARIEAEALAADARLLEAAYRALHPGLLRYNTPRQLAARFAALGQAFNRPQSQSQALLALARFTAGIRCGHTYPNPYNQTDAAVAALFGARDRLPFQFRWIGGRMVVLRDLTGEAGLKRGAEITTLNGEPTARLLADLMPLVRADGHNDAKRVNNLEVRGENRWDAFDLYLPLIRPGGGEQATLGVRDPDGRRRTVRVRLMTAAERQAAAPPAAEPNETDPIWRLETQAGGIAVLTMPSWALYDSKWNWKAWLAEGMERLTADRAPALVIDLRGNEGGEDCGDYILPWLIETPLTPRTERRLTRYRKVPAELNPHLDTWDRSFRDWGAEASGPDPDGFYELAGEPGDVVQPAARRFGGRVFVLADASNSSATFQFGQTIKENRLATIVGQTSGGNRRGINGGAFFFLRLPGSGLEVDLPLIGRFPTTPQPDAGVEPDIAVRPTAAAIAEGRDLEMAAVMAALG